MDDIKTHNKADNLEFFAKESTGANQVPIDIDLGNDEDLEVFNTPLVNNQPAPLNQPYTFWQNVWHGGVAENTLASIKEWADHRQADLNPLDDYVSPNWKINKEEALEGIDKRYANYVLGATGDKDLMRRRNYVLDVMEENRRIQNGSLIGHALGGFALGTVDPITWLPIAKALKYGKVSQTFMQAIPKVLPSVSLGAIARESVMQTTKADGNLEDFFLNVFSETVLGTAFMSGLGAASSGIEAMKAFNAKGYIKLLNNGIEPRPVLDKKGVVTGWRATPMDGSVSAAAVNKAQEYLDHSMAKNALYSIPYFGDKIGSIAGKTGKVLGGFISPQLRMATSRFPTLRALIAHAADSGFETELVSKGEAQPPNFADDFQHFRNMNTGLYKVYRGMFLARNGIVTETDKAFGQTKANFAAKIKSKKDENWEDERAFGRQVTYTMINKTESNHAEVNEAAEFLTKTMLDTYTELRELLGISEKILPPETALGYLPRSYHYRFLESGQGEKRWLTACPIELAKYDQEIEELQRPIKLAKERYNQMKDAHASFIKNENLSDAEIKHSADKLLTLKKQIKQLKENLQNRLREDHNLKLHVEDIHALSANEAKQIKKIKKPIRELEKKYHAQKDLVEKLRLQSFSKEEAAIKSKTVKTAKKNIKKGSNVKSRLEPEEIKLNKLKDDLDKAKLDLEDKMASGEIDKALFYQIPESNRYALKDEKNRLKLRETFKSDFERQQFAKAQYDSIMSNTNEDLINNMLYGMVPSLNPNSIKPRKIMYRDMFLYENDFLHPEPIVAVMNYQLALGRKIAYQKMLNRLTINGKAEELVENLKKDYETEKESIKGSKKYEKKLRKLNKEYKGAQEDFKNTIDKILGKTKGGKKMRQYTAMANLFAVSTKLGFLPFTMTTDLMANVFKHGLWPFIYDGLVPILKGLGGTLNTHEGQAIRENAAHALLADNTLALTYADRNWMGNAQDYVPIQGKLHSGLERLAHFSMNFSGANQVQDLIERWSALIVQSKIMRSMHKFIKGELKPGSKDYRDLLRYGLDPKEYAERFMKGWHETGKSTVGSGSYLAKYWEWSDIEAANKMSRTIHRAVRDTVIKRGMFDAPFAMDDPLINSILLFKGYVFASLNRYLIPLLQKPDANKLIGTLLMMAVGATQNPLRRIINGQDPMEENDHMFRNAMRDGGVFSIMADGYEEANFLTSGFFQNLTSNERYRNRLEMGVFNGPIGGMANDTTRIIGMVLSGELNQTDLKRMSTLMPLVNSWQFRALITKSLEDSGLAKTRGEAQRYKEISS